MNLLYFGASQRQLFGAYEAPSHGGRRGVVLCNPWGQEYLRAHQSTRLLARFLTNNGLHVLRFDWYASGDSAGECTEGGELDSWQRDLEFAIDELRDMAGIKRVSLVGLRLGAAAAARAAGERRDIDRLVLWDPILDGRAYIESLLAQPKGVVHPIAYAQDPAAARGETIDVLGFPITPAMRSGMDSLGLGVIRPGLPPVCLVSTVDDPERYDSVREQLEKAELDWSDERFDGPEAWVEEGDFGTSGMPVPALRRIAEWLS